MRDDLEGHGRSPLSGRPGIESWADDLEALLDPSELPTAGVVGHSMGTLVVQHVAATRPERVERLALLGPAHEQPAPAREATRARAAARAGGTEAVAATIVANATSPATQRDQPAVAAFVRELLVRRDPEGYAAAGEALAGATNPDLGRIGAPVLLLTGADDKASPPAACEAPAAELASASVEVLDGCGHWTAAEAARPVSASRRAPSS